MMTDDEINAYLADELMGYRHTETTLNTKRKGFTPCFDITQAIGDGGPETVLGAMRVRGWRVELSSEQYSRVVPGKTTKVFYDFGCAFFRGLGDEDDPTYHYRVAPTPKRAVCLAAVEALKGGGDENL